MGGPGIGVLSPYAPEAVRGPVREELRAAGLVQDEADPGLWYSADGRPYAYEIQPPEAESDPAELALVAAVAGVSVHSEIVVYICVSALDGRPLLARVAQRVAARLDGWVSVEFAGPPSPDLVAHLRAAGRVIPIDDRAIYLDAAATAAWIDHPDFHVVK